MAGLRWSHSTVRPSARPRSLLCPGRSLRFSSAALRPPVGGAASLGRRARIEDHPFHLPGAKRRRASMSAGTWVCELTPVMLVELRPRRADRAGRLRCQWSGTRREHASCRLARAHVHSVFRPGAGRGWAMGDGPWAMGREDQGKTSEHGDAGTAGSASLGAQWPSSTAPHAPPPPLPPSPPPCSLQAHPEASRCLPDLV